MSYTAVDLSQLPPPDIIEEISFEQVFAEMLDDLKARDSQYDALVESDPAYAILQVAAYRETLLRQRQNESALAVMLAYSVGADLDNIGARFDVPRLLLEEGDPNAVPPVEPVYEKDADYRLRIQLSQEGKSTAGPEGAYEFHARSADANVADVAIKAPKFSYANLSQAILDQLPEGVICLQVDDDAGLANPMPGDVAVTILSRQGNGTADQPLLDTVSVRLSAHNVRPLTDRVTTRSAEIVDYIIDAVVEIESGPGADIILQAAVASLQKLIDKQSNIGEPVAISAIYAALHVEGVKRVIINSPTEDVPITDTQAANCTESNVVVA
ncbi:baseplate assembly protein [Maricurvus nonylphenolicus]|uniref:baseplate assembly protein n=1 Tax=Maricurvus nonylphenolicus TaxID=1008307 RepID=UPI0036F24AE1